MLSLGDAVLKLSVPFLLSVSSADAAASKKRKICSFRRHLKFRRSRARSNRKHWAGKCKMAKVVEVAGTEV